MNGANPKGGDMATAVLDDLKGVYNRTWWAILLRGLLALTVGVFIFARPLDSVAAFALVIAWWALFSGYSGAGRRRSACSASSRRCSRCSPRRSRLPRSWA